MQDTRQKILQTAGELFSQKGYSAISMREIAMACDLSKPAIYHHFASKEHLYMEVLQREVDRFLQALDEAAAQPGTTTERLQAVVRRYLNLLRQKLSLLRLVLRDVGMVEEHLQEALFQRRGSLIRPIRQLLEEGVERGEFRPVNPTLAALSLMGTMNVFITRSVLLPDVQTGEDEILHTVDLFLNGLLPR